MTDDWVREEAEQLYESIGGDLCICQRADVSHWCEDCQQRIGKLMACLRAGYQRGLREAARQLEYEGQNLLELMWAKRFRALAGEEPQP